jgi:hypothetical protein
MLVLTRELSKHRGLIPRWLGLAQLEADLRAMWSNDEQGTKEVQPQNGRPN